MIEDLDGCGFEGCNGAASQRIPREGPFGVQLVPMCPTHVFFLTTNAVPPEGADLSTAINTAR